MSIVTTTQLRAYLEQVETGASVDAKLDDIIERAEGIVSGALGFTFFDSAVSWSSTSATQKVVRAEQSRYLKLPPYLYGSITSVKPATATEPAAEGT